ncbi:BT_3987 domain-containing protein [Sphingobacterium chuzhouense]|uniref:DUF1735 domain-containing protein n=1 Tax=Sphingobacterium chuzhouense TaxID=1742264 RepID=A0ABR7XP19_9SPHI|nr:DUF1735 domain-containing protein [Sphingobacterium chuzhouense]MBD1420888.1 DUF1735 domain-containing protein [Sphingobacterium chuzhouense]
MKKELKRYFRGLVAILIISAVNGCKSDYIDVLDKEKYTSLYIPQANNAPKFVNVYVREEDQTFDLSVYLGGVDDPKQDVTVTLDFFPELVEAFNAERGTSYSIMPEGSYEFGRGEVIIAAGQPHSTKAIVTVKTSEYLEAYTPYLLPVGIKDVSDGTAVNQQLGVAYFVVAASFEPGNVPREEILDLGTVGATIAFQHLDNLMIRDANGTIKRFVYNSETEQFSDPITMGSGWNVIDFLAPYGSNYFISRIPSEANGRLFRYPVSAEGVISTGTSINTGWNIFDRLVIYRGNILARFPDGRMLRYPLDSNGNLIGTNSSLGDGWSAYSQILPYKNTLLCIEPSGALWEIPITADGVVSPRRQLGSGWDMYKLIVPFGDDLLAIASDNKVYRYRFNPNGFWPLKE